MISDHMTGIEAFEAGLWKIADDLRANSGLASNEYFMPIMGLLCRRRFKSEPPRRPNIEPGVEADFGMVGCR